MPNFHCMLMEFGGLWAHLKIPRLCYRIDFGHTVWTIFRLSCLLYTTFQKSANPTVLKNGYEHFSRQVDSETRKH